MSRSLNLHLGMQFASRESREDFFARADADPQRVPFGAALSHVAATNLGIWGDRSSLFRDCARIMAAELRRHLSEKGFPLTGTTITPEAVAWSPAFERAFDLARHAPEARIHNAVRSFGNNSRHMDAMEPESRSRLPQDAAALYDDILNDVERHTLSLRHRGRPEAPAPEV